MNKKPNIIAILIDDMGWKYLSYMGSNFYESPNIDRLCERGMSFSRAYAACPVCSPSRASFLTGKYTATVGVTNWIANPGVHPRYGKLIDAPYIDHLPLEETTVAHLLKNGGYDTWHVGKWHLGDEPYWPEKVGFDVNIGGCHWGRPRNGYVMPCGIPTLPERPIFWHYPHYSDPGGTPAAIVIMGEWKLIEFYEDLHTELYNIGSDPSELCDLTVEMPKKSEEMLNLLHDWQNSIKALMPERNPDYIPLER